MKDKPKPTVKTSNLYGGPFDGGVVEDLHDEVIGLYLTKKRVSVYFRREDGHYQFIEMTSATKFEATMKI